jgi:hypothetical protein
MFHVEQLFHVEHYRYRIVLDVRLAHKPIGRNGHRAIRQPVQHKR